MSSSFERSVLLLTCPPFGRCFVYTVHKRYLLFTGKLCGFGSVKISFHWREVVNEKMPVKMIDFVLYANGQQSGSIEGKKFSLEVLSFNGNFCGSVNVCAQPGD